MAPRSRFAATLLLLAALSVVAAVTVAAQDDEGEPSGPYTVPAVSGGKTSLLVSFQDDDIELGNVLLSTASKYKGQDWEVEVPGEDKELPAGIEGDQSLVLQEAAKHYGVVMPFPDGALKVGDEEDFVLQYEVRLTEGLECGGAYVKVLADEPALDVSALQDDSPYVIMFGPDKCGATNKVHFILRHRNGVSGEVEEKHMQSPPTPKTGDTHSHLYTLIVRSDNSFEIKVDGKSVKSGSLLEDMDPPVNPPEEIDDPDDEKPVDWVDEARIRDPDASKPDDWDEDAPEFILDEEASMPDGWLVDEPAYVEDPDVTMPDDWDEDEDGEFEAPLVDNPKCVEAPGCGEWVRPKIKNPEYKGKWVHPMIDNPEYEGEWEPRKIPNPNYFVDEHPARLPAMAGVAIEIWTMSAGVAFDNVLVTDSEDAAAAFADATWAPKHDAQVNAAKIAKAEADRAERQRKFEEGGFMNVFNFYLVEFLEWCVDNPIVSVIGLVGVVGLIFYSCIKMASDDDKAPVYTDTGAPGVEGIGGSDDDGVGDSEDDGEGDGDDAGAAATGSGSASNAAKAAAALKAGGGKDKDKDTATNGDAGADAGAEANPGDGGDDDVDGDAEDDADGDDGDDADGDDGGSGSGADDGEEAKGDEDTSASKKVKNPVRRRRTRRTGD